MENLSSDPGYIWKEQYKLEGIPTETLQALPIHSSTSQRGIKLKKPNITIVLTRCHITETRKEVFLRSDISGRDVGYGDNRPI